MRHRLLKLATVLCLRATITAFSQQSDSFAPAAPGSPVSPADSDSFAEAPPGAPAPPVLSSDPFIRDGKPVGQRASVGESGDNVSLFVEFIEMDPLAFTELISDASLALSNGDTVRMAASELMKSGQATLVDSCLLTSMGGRAKLRSVGEIVYPVKWDRGTLFEGKGEDRREVTAKTIDGKVYWPSIMQPHPTVFEMRPVGLALDSSFRTSLG